jgi:flavin reductase (DIM6/NTAB) family NADH-FMN oxidoreductase RutF
VSIVTTRAQGLVHGITASSFASLSLDPPLVLVCVGNRSRILPMIDRAGAFAVSVLASEQHAASRYFAAPGREPAPAFAGVDVELADGGLPLIRDALAQLTCRLHAAIVQGDHTIVVGRVLGASARADRRPLLYHRRRYGVVDELPPS